MSDQPTLGTAVVKATQFLRTIHRDTQLLLDTIDEMLGQRGWMPTEKGRISSELGNGIHDTWAIGGCYRFFVPKGHSDGSTRVVGFYIAFLPPSCWEHAICLAMAAHLAEPKSLKDLWDEWEEEGESRVLQWLAGKVGTQEIPTNLLTNQLFPSGLRGVGLVVSLEKLTDPNAVRSELVDPMLDAEARLAQKQGEQSGSATEAKHAVA